jgi:serine/threonine protein kinase
LYDILNKEKLHFGWQEMLGFAIQLAQGIQSLHMAKPQVLHRDVKSMNFLVTEQWIIKGKKYN